MKKSLLPALRRELEHSFGRKIVSSRDCLQMVEDIYQKTGYSINANTLRRFFGLVKTSYSASPSTLTILCKYCGFNSIDEIENINTNSHPQDSINKEEVLHYLTGLFKQLPLEPTHSGSIMAIVQQTIHFLERNPSLIDRFQREIARTPAGQYHYFELAVNMDRLNGYYGDGLRHYLRAKNNDEARAFHHALQVMRYWLTDNLPLLEANMSAIQELPTHGHAAHVTGRLMAARIFYAHVRNEPTDRILLDAARYHVSVISKKDTSSYPHFELAICEALVLTNHIEEAQEFIRKGKKADSNDEFDDPFLIWEQISSSKKNNHAKKAEAPHNNHISLPENGHINKKYNNLLYSFFHSRKQVDLLKDMIQETGFTKFNNIGG